MRFAWRRRLTPRPNFWVNVFEWDESAAHRVSMTAIAFALFAGLIWFVDWITPKEIDLGVGAAPYEYAGAILGSLLVLRTNAGLDRWWEGRKLWGGITNQSRNLAIIVLANASKDPGWCREVVGWIAAFGHVSRRSLRRQKTFSEIEELVGAANVEWIAKAEHKPGAVAWKIAVLLGDARDRGILDQFAYLKAEDQRAMLIDHIGACERILKTPLAHAYVVLIREFIVLFLITLPFALLRRVEWLTPFITLAVAYPILALDHIADDLQHPFSTKTINHLPLNDITTNIETNLFALLAEASGADRPESRFAPAATGA